MDARNYEFPGLTYCQGHPHSTQMLLPCSVITPSGDKPRINKLSLKKKDEFDLNLTQINIIMLQYFTQQRRFI